MVKPPAPGDESYESYSTESAAVFASLKRRAEKLVRALNELEGVSCCTAQGAWTHTDTHGCACAALGRVLHGD